MSIDGNLGRRGMPVADALAANVAGEGAFLHTAVNARLFERLKSRDLGVCQPLFEAALGEGPASAAGPNQQEFDATAADPVAHGSHLLASPQFAKLRRTKESGCA